jgi:hypothetical protein
MMPRPATKYPFGQGATILVGAWCPVTHVPMNCSRDCDVCNWHGQMSFGDDAPAGGGRG